MKLRKCCALLLALVTALVLSVPALAAGPTGRLTIQDTADGRTYELYRVFDLTQSGDNYAYSVHESFRDFFQEKAGRDADWSDPVSAVEGLRNDADELSRLAQELYAYAVEKSVVPAETVTAHGTQAVSGSLPYGYYLMCPVGGGGPKENYATMFSLGTLSGKDGDTTITVKSEYPTVEKKVLEGAEKKDRNSASIGSMLVFQITAKVPDMTGYTDYTFRIEDTLSEGLTFDSVTSVKVGTSELADGTGYTMTTAQGADNKTVLTVDFKNFLQYLGRTGEEVTVTYQAALNEKAAVGKDPNTNTVRLTYSNDPKTDRTGQSEASTTETYTTGLTILKTDGGGQPLSGAAFRIEGTGVNRVVTTGCVYAEDPAGTYRRLKDGTYSETAETEDLAEDTKDKLYKLVTEKTTLETKTGVKAEAFVDSAGRLEFSGLGAGTYTVTETVTPAGYNSIDPITLEIGFDENTGKFTVTGGGAAVTEAGLVTMTVVNRSGSLLPSTGGVGTTVFYVLGGLLTCGALVLLVTKKRMDAGQ